MHFSAKKLFLIGFVFLLLVGIPATVYLVQQQQETRSRAAPATTLSFSPTTSQGEPKQLTKGEIQPLDIMVDPGTNVVTLVKMEIDYDPDKIQIVKDSFQPNTAIMSISAGPVYTSNSFSVTLSAGFDPGKAIQVKQRIGTLKIRALATTDPNSPTRITFSNKAGSTLITSLGATDQASENVFNAGGSSPAVIAIVDASASPSPSDAPTDAPTAIPTLTAVTGTITPAPTGNSGSGPVCSSLSANATSGQAPLAINFTAVGTSTDPNTISKVTFNFGDGQVSDVTTGGGIGTNTVNVPLAHTYSTAGTFQATAVMTDNVNGVSGTTNCSQTIAVAGANATTGPATATPTLAPTGSIETTIGIGAVAGFMMIGGALLFFLL